MLLAVGDDVFGHRRRNARHIAQKARARRVDVHAHAVHHVLHHVPERARELRLVEVVLVLAHADGLRRNLDELRERVLQAASQTHGAARGDVEIGVLLARELARGVDRRARLVDDGVAELRRLGGDEVGDDLLRLSARRAVADDDGVDAVARDQARQLPARARHITARGRGVDDAVVEKLAVSSSTATLQPVR